MVHSRVSGCKAQSTGHVGMWGGVGVVAKAMIIIKEQRCFRGNFHFYYYIDGGVHCHAVVDVDSRTYRRTAENWYPAVHGGVDVRLLNRRKIAVCQ